MSLLKKTTLPEPGRALPGRSQPVRISNRHFVNGHVLQPPFPDGIVTTLLGMGCFWGAERLFWSLPGVYSTAVGYGGGQTENPTYEEVCSGLTGHTELVMVAFDPSKIDYRDILRPFFEEHDPTQGMRQGNDIGTQYRSALYGTTPEQVAQALAARDSFQKALAAAGKGWKITTEISAAPPFYYAEEYHQQYLAKNPAGYCGLKGTGIACRI